MDRRPVWAEINMSAIANNVRQIKSLIQNNARFCAVVKADGYGHGAVKVANAALQAGADWLAVAIAGEAVELRQAGFQVPILVLGYTPPEQAELIVKNKITQTVFTVEDAKALSAAAVMAGQLVKVHIKIDTGMSRLGVQVEDAGNFVETVTKLPNILVEGVFSHFATADSQDKGYAELQFSRFQQAIERIESRGITIPVKHIANSAAVLDMPHTHLDMVRPGIIMYGLWPSDEVEKRINLQPAMQLKARIAYVKKVPSEVSISYGRIFTTARPSMIATLPLGYADGFTRMLTGKAGALVNRQWAPLVGRICMDQCMVDVTDIPNVNAGDEVILFGSNDNPTDKIARQLGTINYEIVCMVGKRVPRLYIGDI